jgi:predicted component of type VI protein secretion system
MQKKVKRPHPPALVSRLNVNCYGNHSMKKLLELRQQKAALKTQMRSMLESRHRKAQPER